MSLTEMKGRILRIQGHRETDRISVTVVTARRLQSHGSKVHLGLRTRMPFPTPEYVAYLEAAKSAL